jgi:hypothetical protein
MIRGIIPAVVGCLLVSLILPGYFVLEAPTIRHIQLFIGFAGVYGTCAVGFIGYTKRLVRKEQTSRETIMASDWLQIWLQSRRTGAGD